MKFSSTHSNLIEVLKDDFKLNQKRDEVCKNIINNSLDIAVFVEQLGPGLTHDERSIRMNATMLLSKVLGKLPPEQLNQQQLEFIVAFYCDRTKDHHSLIPAILDGVLALAAMRNIPSGSASKVLSSLFLNIPCQSQMKTERAKYLQIIKAFASGKKDELSAMGADFLYGVIGAIDGERDPRNLIFLFDYMPTFLQQYPLLQASEEMFEIFACYFPIDFHPNQNDPEAITRDVLAEKLEECLCGSNEFAPFCIPLLLDKIESDLIVAKQDSLRLLIKCVRSFSLSDVDQHLDDIWKALKSELLPGTANKDIFELALEATKHVVIAMYADERVGEGFLTTIFATIIGFVADVQSKRFDNCVRIALTCADTCTDAAIYVSNKLFPIILPQILVETTTEQQNICLIDVLSQTLIICKNRNTLWRIESSLIDAFQRKLIQVLFQMSNSSQLERTALKSVTSAPEIVCDENRPIVYTTIVRILSAPSNDDHSNVEDCLDQFASHFPQEVEQTVVDVLMSKTYESSALPTGRIFNALARLLPFDTFRDRILQFFLALVLSGTPPEDVAVLALKSLKMTIEKSNGTDLAEVLQKRYEIVDKFVEKIRGGVLSGSDDLIFMMSEVMKEIIKHLNTEQQQSILNKHIGSVDLSKANELYILAGVLGTLDATIDIEDHVEKFVADLAQLAMNTDNERVKEVSQHLLCSLFNRLPDRVHHREHFTNLLGTLRKELSNGNHKVISVLSWICKGLLAKGHPVATEIVEDIVKLLEHPSLGNDAVLGFDILSAECPQLHIPFIKNLFKQKLFVSVMKMLERKTEEYAETHLRALMYVFKTVPHLVLKMNIEKVGPILLKCLSIGDKSELQTTLEIILQFLKERDVFFRDHLQTLIPHLLKLSVYKSSMKVRIDALECLLHVTKYPPFLLLPLKMEVVLKLQDALNDHKRLVRSAAATARLRWFLIGTDETSSQNEQT
ncbi:MMS19 nucleotide excision repair protein isoform X2 [Toxorhynchites rutilus septentrionalis]|uniref:MMS19 nucleotide excision repair protein isoform X2 n=1 Tax=Toxorhynchites rutilus septentrionalis TaxID=329112 RepID=UPI00247ACA5D|nr:MMS19 nucleotide excision repair protein isoform X2 [Toxorhynchites rutilus septentrionalis]